MAALLRKPKSAKSEVRTLTHHFTSFPFFGGNISSRPSCMDFCTLACPNNPLYLSALISTFYYMRCQAHHFYFANLVIWQNHTIRLFHPHAIHLDMYQPCLAPQIYGLYSFQCTHAVEAKCEHVLKNKLTLVLV